MKNNEIIQVIDKQTIESMIYIIRGQKVMLDFDLAKIYGYSTTCFNEPTNLSLCANIAGFLKVKDAMIKEGLV